MTIEAVLTPHPDEDRSKYGVYNMSDGVHIIPPLRGPEHFLTKDCWCEPELFCWYGGEEPIWTHREIN